MRFNERNNIIMKKMMITVVMSAILFAVANHVTAEDGITVYVNGEEIVSDVPAMIINDRTVLPMRTIFEKLGANVTWMAEDQLIFATKGEDMMVMQIGNSQMSVQTIDEDCIEVVDLDTAPFVYNDRTFVPVRAVAEALDANVVWDSETQAVNVTL